MELLFSNFHRLLMSLMDQILPNNNHEMMDGI